MLRLPLVGVNIQMYRRLKYMVQDIKEVQKVQKVALKYGFCKKSLLSECTTDQLNTFFLTFWYLYVVLEVLQMEEKSVQLVRGAFGKK